MIIEGKLIKCEKTAKEFKGKKGDEKTFITLAEVKLSDKQRKELNDAFKDSGDKFTPGWMKNFEGYVNLSTVYEIPVRVDDQSSDNAGDEFNSLLDVCVNNKVAWLGAKVKLSVNIKEGAVYPKACLIIEEGEPFNPFAEFDN